MRFLQKLFLPFYGRIIFFKSISNKQKYFYGYLLLGNTRNLKILLKMTGQWQFQIFDTNVDFDLNLVQKSYF